MATRRIGVDARCLAGDLTGIGRYVREIMLQLDAVMPDTEWLLYSRRPIGLSWPSERWKVVLDTHPLWRWLPGVLWVKWRLRNLVLEELDAFWAPATLAPTRVDGLVATVHDLNHVLVPETMAWINRHAYRHWFNADVRRANIVVANSAGTASRLVRHVGRHADFIARPGGRWQGMAEVEAHSPAVTRPYLLAVGTLEPRKNLGNLIRAVKQLKAQGAIPDHGLVLVGAKGWGRSDKDLSSSVAPEWLQMLGYVPDRAMPSLYAYADLVVQPSIYEGYGMPVAEAAAFGVRVLAHDIPELREASGNTGTYTGIDVESLANGILTALERPRPQPVSSSTWYDAATEMRRAFHQAFKGRGLR